MKTLIKVELIDSYIKEHKITLNKFCKISKIAPSTIKRMRENRNVRIPALIKLVKILKLSSMQILNFDHDKMVK